jgi:hypothetical protein
MSKQRKFDYFYIFKNQDIIKIFASSNHRKVGTHFVQLIFTLDFSFATLGVQGIAVSPIHTPSMESVVGFSSLEGGKRYRSSRFF